MIMPALLTTTSIDLKRDTAISTTRTAVANSPIFPSTSATRSEARTSADFVMLRELATTLKSCWSIALTMPAPIPWEAPVTMAVLVGMSKCRASVRALIEELLARDLVIAVHGVDCDFLLGHSLSSGLGGEVEREV